MNMKWTIIIALVVGVSFASAQPVINSLSPASGPIGTSVTISGLGFNTSPSNNIVFFGGVRATVTAASATSLTVQVPAGAAYAPVSVTNGGQTGYSRTPFLVTFGALAQIDSTSFAAGVSYPANPETGTVGVVLGDIDGDGKVDIVTANAGSGSISIFRNNGSSGGFESGSFASPITFAFGTTPARLALGDLDGDGKLDIAVSDSSEGNVYVWMNGSTPGTIDSVSLTSVAVGTNPFGLSINDMDFDGKPDIVVANEGSDNVSVLKNSIALPIVSFSKTDVSVGAGSQPVDVRTEADIDADGIVDIVTVNRGNARTSVLLNQGSMLFNLIGTTFSVGTDPSAFVIVDLDGDGKPDIVTANYGAGTISLLRNTTVSTGTPTFASAVNLSAGSAPFAINVGDLDGDGKPDLAVANRSVDSLSIFRNTAVSGAFSSSTLAAAVHFSTGATPSGIGIADLDQDGKPEIASANQADADAMVFRNRAVRVMAETGNDTTSTAPISIGETIQSVLTSGTDVDYYSFVMNPGDTVSIDTHAINNSDVTVEFELRDTSGTQYKGSWTVVDQTQSWHVFAPSLVTPRKYILRVVNAYNNTSFPSSKHPGDPPPPIAGSTAAADSGWYQLSVERFAPTAPKVYYYAGLYNISYNRARWWTEVYPNGISTSVSLEYSTSSDFTGSTLVPATSSPGTGINRLYFDSPVSGLSPNTKYYYRIKATNALGTAYSTYTQWIQTPPMPVGWVHQNTGSNGTVMGISYGDDTTGVAVGYGIGRKHTTDGGSTWSTFTNPASSTLWGVWMVNSLVGYAVGSGESIIKTLDGGANWTMLTNTASGQDLWRVKFANLLKGVAVGSQGLIITTGNQGASWAVSRSPGGYDLRGVDYADLNTIVAVGLGGTILRSSDGGASWDSIPSPTTNNLYGVDFTTSSIGYIVGDNGILKTVNGGLSWSNVNPPEWTSFYDIAFKDANNGLIVGAGGFVLRTSDGGSTWQKQVTGTEVYFNSASYRGRSLAVGGDQGLVLSALDPQAESEPNDSTASATLLAYRDEVNARIDPGDVDYYKFTVTSADTVALFVQSRDSLVVNGLLELLDVDGTTVLESNDDFVPGDTVRARIVRVLPAPGTYYARYSGVNPSSSGDYRLSLNVTGLTPVIPFGGVATIATTSEVILKSPVVPNNLPTTITFEYGTTTAYDSTANADQVNPGGQQLVNATTTLTGLLPFTPYHFRVKATNAAGTAYGPDVTFLTALGTLRTETEGNNTVATANTIFVGDTVQATISSNSDVDYYRFQAAAGDSLEIFVNERDASGLEARVQVVDSAGNTNMFVDNNYLPDSKNVHAAFVAVNTGVYHVRVTYAYNYSTSYPSKPAPSPLPRLGDVAGSAATITADNGAYELRLRKFSAAAPDVRKSPWADVTYSTAALIHADVTSGGLPTDVFLEYGTTPSLGSSTQYASGPITKIEYPFWFRIPLSGLTPGTQYYFRLKATNALGTNYSDVASFNTRPASPRWSLVSPNTDTRIIDVAAAADSIMIALGDNRNVFRSTDAGATWNESLLPRYSYGIAFKDQDTAFAVSYAIVRTGDKGASWQWVQDMPSGAYGERLRFFDGQVGAAVGEYYNQSQGQWIGLLVRTRDGGATWELMPPFDQRTTDISFVSADTAIISSSTGWIYRTTNFTATTPAWDSLQVTNGYLGQIHFITKNVGLTVGSGIFRTTDGGTAWAKVSDPNIYDTFYAIAMKNSLIGIAVGGNGRILRTANAGATWTTEESGAGTYLYSALYMGRFALTGGDVGTILRAVDPLTEQEPNDSSGSANSFAIGEQVAGVITAGDVDFYAFSASANDTLKATLTGVTGSPVNGVLALVGTDGTTTFVQNDDFVQGDTSAAQVVFVISGSGTYYLRVSGSSPASAGAYLLALERSTLRPVITSAGIAALTPTTASIKGYVDPNGLATNVFVQWDSTSSVYGTTSPVDQNPLAAGQQRRLVTATLSGLVENSDYHFRLIATNAPGDTVLGNDILLHTPRATAIAETEPNDSASMPLVQEITFGDSVNGSINPSTDIDYYKVRIAAGDTLEVYASRRDSSGLIGRIGIIDSSTTYYWANTDWFPTNAQMHLIVESSSPATLYLRYNYSYNYATSFPGTGGGDVLQPPKSIGFGVAQTAAEDTGAYRLFVRRFRPSAPDGQDFVGSGSVFADAVQLQTTIQPNGQQTTVNYEYGTTTAYGNQVPSADGPYNGIYQVGSRSPLITGLQPGTTYYVRTVLTNASGTSYGGGNTIQTPPAAEGWTRMTSGLTSAIWDAAFPSQQVGYLAGSQGSILKSTDGGTTWSLQTSGTGVDLRGISFVSDLVGTAVGGSTTILRTNNGGSTWISQLSGGSVRLFDVKMLTASEIVAVGGNGGILRSSNSGASWDTVHVGNETFRNVVFPAGSDTGYAVGYDQNSGNGVVFRTIDRGQNWTSITAPSPSSFLSAWFFTGSTGLVAGGGRTFYRTTDAGATWTTISTTADRGYYAYGLTFADNNNGVAVGDGGMILRTYDGGQSWVQQQSGTYNNLFGSSIAGRALTAVGDYGTVLQAFGLLAPPTNLTATYTAGDTVLLGWSDNTSSESGFIVERKTGAAGIYALVTQLGSNSVSYVDHPLRGRVYFYRVSAYIAGSDTAASGEDSASVYFAAPANLMAASGGSSSINLSWQSMADAKDGFKIDRATSAGGPFSQIDSVNAGITTYANTGLGQGAQYFYRIRSYNSTFTSSYSNVDSARTALGKPQNTTANPASVTNGPITISWTAPNGADSVWFATDSPPLSAGPPATRAPVSSNSFVITNPPPGLHWLYYVLQDPDGNVDLNAYDSVQIAFDNTAPQITDQTTLPTITITGSAVSDPASVTITASIVKTGGISALNPGVVEYKKTNSNTISQSPFPGTSGGTVTLNNLNSLFLTIGKPNGVEYRIKATDQAGNVATTVWKSFTVFVSNPPVSDFVTPAAGTSDDATTLVASYRLFSVPYDLQDKKPSSFMESTDKGLGAHQKDGVNYYFWRMQRYVNGSYQDYEDFKGQDVLIPGAAFFLISREQKFVTVGAGNLVKAQDMFNNGIQVTQGWNLIGNPFPDDFPADSLFVLAGSITDTAYYDGTGPDGGWWKSGSNVHTLKKWEGLAINVTQSTSLRFKAVPQARKDTTIAPPAASIMQTLSTKENKGWLFRFDATRNGSSIRDVDNLVGVAPDAKTGYDHYDSYQPPLLPGRSLALYFKNADGAMSNDIRPPAGDGETWEMKVVTGDRGARVTLNVKHLVEIPDLSSKAFLLDLDDRMAYDLRQRSEIEFGSKEGLRNMRLTVGTKQYVDSVSASYGIDLVPKSFRVFQNYPNPFNPSTVIRFAVPGVQPSYKVTLKIYNILGQEVKVLLDDNIQPGYYEKTWNAVGYASGTYFMRLTIDGGSGDSRFSGVKKMVLIK